MVTGERELSSSAVREYFLPLETWLTTENGRNQERVIIFGRHKRHLRQDHRKSRNMPFQIGWKVEDYSRMCEGLARDSFPSASLSSGGGQPQPWELFTVLMAAAGIFATIIIPITD